jgi:hypothetical protein
MRTPTPRTKTCPWGRGTRGAHSLRQDSRAIDDDPQGLEPLVLRPLFGTLRQAQGRLEVAPFHVSSNLQCFSAACKAAPLHASRPDIEFLD